MADANEIYQKVLGTHRSAFTQLKNTQLAPYVRNAEALMNTMEDLEKVQSEINKCKLLSDDAKES